MKLFRSLSIWVLLVTVNHLYAQSDFIIVGSRQYDVIDRLQVKLRKDSVLNFSSVKPYDRKIITERLEYINDLAAKGEISLSKADRYNIDLLLKDNFEWRKGFGDSSLKFSSVFSKSIATHPAYIGIKTGDFSVYASPIFNFQMGKDNNVSSKLFSNTRGIAIRGTLTKGIGYYSYFTENQERDPLYVQQYVTKYSAVPGMGYYKSFGTDGYDYYGARGGIMFKAGKSIDFQFAYDKVFIGDGFRSLILSDFSSPFLFLKVNARFWKFNYYNLFTQLTSTYKRGPDQLLPHKYMAMHYLDFKANKWLNVGFFEQVMFGRENGFDLNYLNPVILYNAVQQQLGSPDKLTVGFNIKANAFRNTQFYSQLIINEFVANEILHYSRGSYQNKDALQLGAKTIDVFGIKNLDVQAEMNLIRPFVYTHYDSVGSFTNYNQPLAHPAGANLREFVALIKYQPIPKLQLEAKAIYYEQGLDSAGKNFGGNIFRFYTDRQGDYGYHIGSGLLTKTLLASFTASYELIPNLFIDANATIRRYKQQNAPDFNSNIYMVGFRMNIQRRTFDF